MNSWVSLQALFVFSISDRKLNARSLLTLVSDPDFYALSCGTFRFVLHGSFFNHFLLVKIIQQPIRIVEIGGHWSYHGEQVKGYLKKEETNLYQKLVSKVTAFCLGNLSRKQTVQGYLCASIQKSLNVFAQVFLVSTVSKVVLYLIWVFLRTFFGSLSRIWT